MPESKPTGPVFIIGAPFSGCEPLMWALAQHPAIAPVPESDWLGVLATSLESVFSTASAQPKTGQLGRLGVNRGHLSTHVGEAVHSMLAAAPGSAWQGASGATRWVASGVESGHRAFGLWQMFPDARFIHVLRDVQEVVHSLTNFGRIVGVPQTEHEAYEAWLEGVEACVRAEQAFGSGVTLRVPYRDLLHRPDDVLRRCFEFIGEASTDSALWPLQLLGNEPRLGETYHPADRDIRNRAKQRSRDLLAEGDPRYEKNQDRIMALKAVFLDRCGRASRAPLSVTERIREIVALHLPTGSRVAVVSRGDDALVGLADCRGEHYPQSPDGTYAGHHPADSAAALAHLEELRARGVSYLLIPEPSFWWLDHYQGLATFLSERCGIVAFVEHTCALFDLRPTAGHVLRFTAPAGGFASAAAAASPPSVSRASQRRLQPLSAANDRAFAAELAHPPPRKPARLPGSIWAITCLYNPHQYRNKAVHYRLFREGLRQAGIPVLTSELAFGDAPFELTDDDADVLIQLRTTDVLWHKERLLNLGLGRLPDDCDKVVWIDCDVLLQNTNWVAETAERLEEYCVVQPFSHCVRLAQGESACNPAMLPFGHREDQLFYGMAFGVAAHGPSALTDFFRHGHPGFAWAARRSILDTHGLYEYNLLGNGDTDIGHAIYGHREYWGKQKFGDKGRANLDGWAEAFHADVGGSVGFVSGVVLHLWHGDVANRQYDKKIDVLQDFDPERDLRQDPATGLHAWAAAHSELKEWSRTYFARRKEESPAKFLVVCPARSGSTLLMSALESHPRTSGILMEPFNTEDGNMVRELIPVMRKVYGKDRLAKAEDDLKPLVDHAIAQYDGFKILYYQIGLGDAVWEYLRAKRLKVIHLTRRNVLERELSLQIAKHTQVWHRREESECPPEPRIRLDACALTSAFTLEQQLFEHFASFFQLSDTLTVAYEDLRDDYAATMREVQTFLALPVVDLPQRYRKRTRKSKLELVTNYGELKAHFQGSDWEHYFDE